MSALTAEILRQHLNYCPETGEFTWKTAHRNRRNLVAGRKAGVLDRGYLRIRVLGVYQMAHRLAWLYVHGEWPSLLDHIDGNPLNNAISNLRVCTPAQNSANTKLRSNNKSGFKGVHRYGEKKWIAVFSADGRFVRLGIFDTAERAHIAYLNAATEHYGEFARTGPTVRASLNHLPNEVSL